MESSVYAMGNTNEAPQLTIYKASAGAGKTFTLSATFIAHLLTDDVDFPHKHQLAVTFTNKATAEMKERIIQYLYDIATGTDDEEGFFKAVRQAVPRRITNKMLRSRARRSLYDIIHDYDHFHVNTIDSFFQSLLSSLAHDLNLSASFKVEIGDKEVIASAVDRLLATVEDRGENIEWLTKYIEERISDDKSWNISDELKTLGAQLLKENYMMQSALLNKTENTHLKNAINLDNKTIIAYEKELRDMMKDERQRLADTANKINEDIKASIGYDRISRGQKIIGDYLQKFTDSTIAVKDLKEPSNTFKGYANTPESMLRKSDQVNISLISQATTLSGQLREFILQYQKSIEVINSCRLSLANLNPLRLLNAIDKEVKAMNRENDRMLLASTPLLFHNLSIDTDASFIFERSGTNYHHVMIDEFQDTSKLQWDNMRQLIVENMSQGNTCMLVGDVKQGIYRFRGGDWNALAGFKSGYNPQMHSFINIETLKTNFRSGTEVVAFNNRIFTSAPAIVSEFIHDAWGEETDTTSSHDNLEANLNIERIYPTPAEEDNHEVTQLPHAEGGFVRIEFLNNVPEETKKIRKKTATEESAEAASENEVTPDAESREASVARQMIRLHNTGVPYAEMAILIRGTNDATPLMKYFEDNHGPHSEEPIALMSEEAFLLEASPAVMTIINALRYVSNNTDKIALAYLRTQCPANRDFESILAVLDKWNQEKYAGLPFYEVSCRLADMFSLHSQKGQSPYLYNFLDAVLRYIDDHTADVDTFLAYWDETLHRKAIPSSAVDGVRILTIHKSKGLAFHSVFIPYCDWQIDKHAELVWTRPSQAPYNLIPLLPIYMSKEAGRSIYREQYKQEIFDKYVENLNLLYVAFTRTKQNLLVWADCSKRGVAPILQKAMNTSEAIIEYGSPSALHISSLTSDGQAEWNDICNITPPANIPQAMPPKSEKPLEYRSTPVFINFTHYDPTLIFRQSNNAELFLHPDDEEQEAMQDAVKNEEEAQRKSIQEDYRKTGILLHNLMATIENSEEISIRIDEAANEGQLPPSISKESVQRLITRRIAHPSARSWFDGSWTLYRECSLVYRETDAEGHVHTVTRRPDRVMMRGNIAEGNDETIVIDFKFGKFKTEHREQVKQYMDLLKCQGRHHVKGYLWYLYTGSIEEVL